MIKKIAYIVTSLGFVVNGISQTVLFEESFTEGLPESWTVIDGDGLIVAGEVEEFTAAWIPFKTDLDTCVASTSYYSPAGQSEDYLITPKIELGTFSRLVWDARSYDASYPDSYLVLLSTTDSLEGSFTDTLKEVNNEVPYWKSNSVNLSDAGYSNQPVFIAIKNITNDGFALLVDNVRVLGSEFVGVENVAKEISVHIFPNPVQNFLRVQSTAPISTVRIFSLDGRLLIDSQDSELNINAFEDGVYIVQVETEEGIYSEQFIKN